MMFRLLNTKIPHDAQKILMVSFSNPGDVILSMPSYRNLQKAFPHARIDIMVGPESEKLMDAFTLSGEVVLNTKRRSIPDRAKFFTKLLKARYDAVVDLRYSYFGLAAPHGSGITIFRPQAAHRRDEGIEVLRRLGVRGISEGMVFESAAEPTGSLICIAPGSKSDLKKWPAVYYAELADRLIRDRFKVCWIGSQEDKEVVRTITGMMSEHSENLAGDLSWSETARMLKQSRMLITNDSAPLHLADDCGCPVLSFFGPTSSQKYGAQRHFSLNLNGESDCIPCHKAQCVKGKRTCLESVVPDNAYDAAMQILKNKDECSERIKKKILIVRLDRIGDLLLSLPAIREIRRKNSSASLTLLVQPHAENLAKLFSDVNCVKVYSYKKGGIHRFPSGYFRFIRQIRSEHFDEVYVLHPNIRSHLLAWFTGAVKRFGYSKSGSFLLNNRIPDIRRFGVYHESEMVTRVAGSRSAAIAGTYEFNNSLRIPDSAQAAAEELSDQCGFRGSEYIVVHSGASAVSKKWPISLFSGLIKIISEQMKCKVVLVGSANEKNDAEILKNDGGSQVIDLTGKTSLQVLAGVMMKSKGVVTNDSGPAHLASAVGANVVSIFGRNEPGLAYNRWRPIGRNSQVVRSQTACLKCEADECRIDFQCLHDVTPEMVIEALSELVS